MKVNITLVVILLIGSTMVSSQEADIYKQDGPSLKISMEEAQDGEAARMRFQAVIMENLELLQTSTTICFKSNDAFEVEDGAKGWGIQWLCHADTCDSNTQIGAYFFAGTSAIDGDKTGWHIEEDLTNGSFSTEEEGDGLHPDTTIGWDEESLSASNLPDLNSDSDEYYKCWTEAGGSLQDTFLVMDIELDDTWNTHEFTKSKPDEGDGEEDQADQPEDTTDDTTDDVEGAADGADDAAGDAAEGADNAADDAADEADNAADDTAGDAEGAANDASDGAEDTADDVANEAEGAADATNEDGNS